MFLVRSKDFGQSQVERSYKKKASYIGSYKKIRVYVRETTYEALQTAPRY